MRKYYRAILTVIAAISLVALIFYRHEYNRLRFVLEAFNYFGPPGAKILSANCTELLIINDNRTETPHANYHFDEPMPAWQRLNDDVYLYSAYALDDQEIRAIGFAKAKRLKLLACVIYYENELEPIVGDFSYTTLESSSSIDGGVDFARKGIYNAYRLRCTDKSGKVGEKRVAGVSFASDKQMSPDAVILPVKTFGGTANESNETAVCVAPGASRTISESDMINFVSHHHAIGVRHYVVYDFGMPPRFNSIFKKIARVLNSELNISYTTVPWNFPFSGATNDVIRVIVEADCRYRTHRSVGIVATLTWDEYIFMKYHRAIARLLRDYVETGLVADRYEVSTTNLCTERDEPATDGNVKPIVLGSGTVDQKRPVYLYKTNADKPAVDDADVKTRPTASDVILVNRYERHCDRSLNLVPQNDSYVGKFSADIRSSPIYKLYRVYAR